MLKRERFWALTIEFWRGDLQAGAKPTEGVTHRRHYFFFRHPPGHCLTTSHVSGGLSHAL